jgi:type VI secretion system protein ImpK
MGVSLREVFTPLFAYVLLLGRTPGQPRSFADLQRDIKRLLDDELLLVKRHDIPMPDYDLARFAAVAWVDELVLRCTHDTARDISQQWKRSPMQVELYNTANAGEEFFEKLAQLRPAQKEIREIYHLCLCLGFRGRYYDESQEYKLVQLRREAAQHLPAPVTELLDIEKRKERITPQPYDVQAPPPRPIPRSLALLWAGLLAAACTALLLYVFWPPAQRPRAEIIAALKEQLKGFTCCHLAVVDFEQENGIAHLAGRAESEQQRQQIRQTAKQVPEVTEVQDSLAIVPRPFCEVIELLEPFQTRAREAGADLSVRPQKGCDTMYVRDESLVVGVSAQKPLQYAYVDYYVADKETVAHLLPNPKQRENVLRAANTLTIGEPGSDPQWQVQPPFGMEMVTAISSPQPLLADTRPAAEPAAGYLEELRRVLPGAGSSSEISASYCFITTQDR